MGSLLPPWQQHRTASLRPRSRQPKLTQGSLARGRWLADVCKQAGKAATPPFVPCAWPKVGGAPSTLSPSPFRRGAATGQAERSSSSLDSLLARVHERAAWQRSRPHTDDALPQLNPLPTLLMATFKHPDCHDSPARVAQVAAACWVANRSAVPEGQVDAPGTSSSAAGPSSHLGSCASDGLRLYLLTCPPKLLKVQASSLDSLVTCMQQHPDDPAPFFGQLWDIIKPHLQQGSWTCAQCFEVGAAVLEAAEQVLASSSSPRTPPSHAATAAGADTAHPQGTPAEPSMTSALSLSPSCWTPWGAPDASSLGAAYKPSQWLEELHWSVHEGVFDAVAAKLRNLVAGVGVGVGSRAGRAGLGVPTSGPAPGAPAAWAAASASSAPLTTPVILALAQESGFRFPNAAQRLLLCIAAYNRRMTGTAHLYVISGQALAATAAAALEPLPLMLVTRAQLSGLMSALLDLAGTCGVAWRPTPVGIAALDDALRCVSSTSVGLPALATLVALRRRLGPLPPGGGPLMAAANEALVGLQVGPGAAEMAGWQAEDPADLAGGEAALTGAFFGMAATPARPAPAAGAGAGAAAAAAVAGGTRGALQLELQLLQGLGTLLEAAAALAAPPAGPGSHAVSSSSPDSARTSPGGPPAAPQDQGQSSGLDVEVLLIKVQMALALGSDGLWGSTEFLCQTYPRMVACAGQLGERPEDLMLHRYADAVAKALSTPSRQRHVAWDDVSCVAAVEAALSPALSETDAAAADRFSALSSFAEDAEPWQIAMQAHLARLLVAGVSNGFIRQQQWRRLLGQVVAWRCECPQLSAALAWALVHETEPFGGGQGFQTAARQWLELAGGSPDGSPAPPGAYQRGATLQLLGAGAITERRLHACLAEGRQMGLAGLPEAPEAWAEAVSLRLAAAAMSGMLEGLGAEGGLSVTASIDAVVAARA